MSSFVLIAQKYQWRSFHCENESIINLILLSVHVCMHFLLSLNFNLRSGHDLLVKLPRSKLEKRQHTELIFTVHFIPHRTDNDSFRAF